MTALKSGIVLVLIIILNLTNGCSGMDPYSHLNPTRVSETITLTTPTIFDFKTAAQWHALGRTINSGTAKTYILLWHGDGGIVDFGDDFIRDIQRAQKHGVRIIIKMAGMSASMHAFVPCYADSVQYLSSAVYMFHSVGYFDHGTYYREDNAQFSVYFAQCSLKGIGGTDLYTIVNSGHEVYFFPTTKSRIIAADERPLG